MNFLLEVTDYSKPVEGFMDKLLFGGQMVLIGMSVVFSVLVLLWISLLAFKLFFHDLPSKRKAKEKVIVATKVEPVKETAVKVQTSDDEIVAVIAAAIAAAESENSGLKFRVVSFKRQ